MSSDIVSLYRLTGQLKRWWAWRRTWRLGSTFLTSKSTTFRKFYFPRQVSSLFCKSKLAFSAPSIQNPALFVITYLVNTENIIFTKLFYKKIIYLEKSFCCKSFFKCFRSLWMYCRWQALPLLRSGQHTEDIGWESKRKCSQMQLKKWWASSFTVFPLR